MVQIQSIITSIYKKENHTIEVQLQGSVGWSMENNNLGSSMKRESQEKTSKHKQIHRAPDQGLGTLLSTVHITIQEKSMIQECANAEQEWCGNNFCVYVMTEGLDELPSACKYKWVPAVIVKPSPFLTMKLTPSPLLTPFTTPLSPPVCDGWASCEKSRSLNGQASNSLIPTVAQKTYLTPLPFHSKYDSPLSTPSWCAKRKHQQPNTTTSSLQFTT